MIDYCQNILSHSTLENHTSETFKHKSELTWNIYDT